MIQIEGHWEIIEKLQDVSRIVREYYNHELANELDRLIEEIEGTEKHDYEELLETIRDLEDIIYQIRCLV